MMRLHCPHCPKLCTSTSGLTLHINAKHVMLSPSQQDQAAAYDNSARRVSAWELQPAETELVWKFGSPYPDAIICTLYETNAQGEKRLVEQKTLKLVEAGDAR